MRTLWFIRGPATPKQVVEAAEKGLTIRDANAYHEGDYIEPADAVLGDAPEAYRAAYGEPDPATPKRGKKG